MPQSKLTNSAAFTYDASNNVEAGSGWSYNYSNQVSSAPPLSGLAGMSGLSYDNAGDLTSAGANTLS